MDLCLHDAQGPCTLCYPGSPISSWALQGPNLKFGLWAGSELHNDALTFTGVRQDQSCAPRILLRLLCHHHSIPSLSATGPVLKKNKTKGVRLAPLKLQVASVGASCSSITRICDPAELDSQSVSSVSSISATRLAWCTARFGFG